MAALLLLLAGKFPTLWKFRKWIGYGLLALTVAISVLAYRHSLIQDGVKLGREQVRKEWAYSISVANGEIEKKNKAYAALQGERDKAKAEVEALRNQPLPAPKTLIREVPTSAPVSSCPRLSPDFMHSYNALADAADGR